MDAVRKHFIRRAASDWATVATMPLLQSVIGAIIAAGLLHSWNPQLGAARVFAPELWVALAAVTVPAGVWAYIRGPKASFIEAALPGLLLMVYGFGRAFAIVTGENIAARPGLAIATAMTPALYSTYLWMVFYMPTHRAHHDPTGRGRGHGQV